MFPSGTVTFAKINTLSKDPEFIGYYNYAKDAEDRIYCAKMTGIREGSEQGMEHGMKQGSINERKFLVQKMFKNGMSIKEFSKITEISIENIQSLLKK